MNIRNIKENITYVGVNDRRTARFEGLWPIPNGVSYNSYIVTGAEKRALMDTVEISEISDFIRLINSTIGDKPIDYLVVNHMEPDHSGGIPAILAHYPEMKLVGNKLTIGMVKGFYHIPDDRFLEIKDGDTLHLGGKTLRFITTPMVHWPETMMTLVEEDKVLFTGDALGTFGALAGAVIDNEMDTELYRREMYRYYACIVGKYGRFVQKALEKVLPLDIEYACPTHGPVWHDELKDVVCVYDRLSRYEPEDGTVIIYGSMYGNTAAAAEIIARKLAESGEKKIIMHDATVSSQSDMITDCFRYRNLVIGAPTYSMSLFPPVDTLMKALEVREIKNKKVALFGSYTWSSAALKAMTDYCERMKLDVVGSVEFKQSVDGVAVEGLEELARKLLS